MNYYEDGYEDGYSGRPRKPYQPSEYTEGYMAGQFDHWFDHTLNKDDE